MMKNSIRSRVTRYLVKSAVVLVSQAVVHAGPAKGAGHAQFPELNLPEVSRGQRALQLLGDKLPEVAAAYGWRVEQLRDVLQNDPSAAVDKHGRIHYTEPMPEAGALAADGEVQAASIPLADTFKLHSKPGAKRTIYLDFDGHLITATGWNTSYNNGQDILAPAWDLDGNPATFGDSERTIIQKIWQRVAEDYAPFDVDVTTELSSESQLTRSSSSDEYYGTRVLISPISQYFGQYGGIAYIGAFDDVGDAYKPALVFPENLGPNGEKYIAEAASHEAGHNLGLRHDGTSTAGYYQGQGSGTTSWAPIMGAGYYVNLTQWSKGEYADANNKEDDLAVMQTYGLTVRADDHGNTAGTASYFPAGTQIAASGIIERNTDVDVFAFTTGSGSVSLSVASTDVGPNLDLSIEVRDANGALLAANNPLDQLNTAVTLNLAAGTYFLHVRGTGAGDPLTTGYTSYGSLGQYTVAGTVVNPAGTVAPIANIAATPATGTAPLVVQFDGSGSFDQDGSIVSYAWNFGDGATGSGAMVAHTFTAAGSYTATLTVTDNSGLTGTSAAAIQVNAPTATQLVRVQSITPSIVRQPSGNSVRVTVKVIDATGVPVPGVTVSGSFDSVVSGTATGTTDSSGNAVLTSRRSKKSGTVTFKITGLSKTGYAYDASQNLQSTATVVMP